MNKVYYVCIAFLLLTACDKAEVNATTQQTKPSTQIYNLDDCGAIDRYSTFCEVSHLIILGQPQAYDKLNVSLVAYLALDQGRLALYPTKEFFLAGDSASSIELDAPYDQLKAISHRFAYRYVNVRGRFERHKGNNEDRSRRFGRLIGASVSSEAMPGVENREQLDPDLKVGDWDG